MIPAIIIALSSIAGAGGIGLNAKGAVDSIYAARLNREAQEKNESNMLLFQAYTENLEDSMNKLGETRLKITKNFNVFIEIFEKIKNRPDFSETETYDLPEFDFDEIKNVSVVANDIIGGTFGAIGGNVMGAAAAGGIKAAIYAFAKASTGKAIKELSGAAAYKAIMAAIGGGAVKYGGGGMVLGTLVLNAASLGVGVLFQGIALAFAGSKSKKNAIDAKRIMTENEQIIKDAINMQLSITASADKMRKAVSRIYKNIYSVLVVKLKDVVDHKTDFNQFTHEEKILLENTMLTVKILNYLNNVQLYKVKKMNAKGEVEEVEENSNEVNEAILNAKKNMNEKGIEL